jgi:hypothetical protein
MDNVTWVIIEGLGLRKARRGSFTRTSRQRASGARQPTFAGGEQCASDLRRGAVDVRHKNVRRMARDRFHKFWRCNLSEEQAVEMARRRVR